MVIVTLKMYYIFQNSVTHALLKCWSRAQKHLAKFTMETRFLNNWIPGSEDYGLHNPIPPNIFQASTYFFSP